MPKIERLQGSHGVLGLNDSRVVLLSWNRTPPGGHFVLVWNHSRGVILSEDLTISGESYSSIIERHQGSKSVLGWNDSRGLVCHRMEKLQGSHSVLG